MHTKKERDNKNLQVDVETRTFTSLFVIFFRVLRKTTHSSFDN